MCLVDCCVAIDLDSPGVDVPAVLCLSCWSGPVHTEVPGAGTPQRETLDAEEAKQ